MSGPSAAAFAEQMKTEEARMLAEDQPWRAQLDQWHYADIDKLALRQPAYSVDHSAYAEPALV